MHNLFHDLFCEELHEPMSRPTFKERLQLENRTRAAMLKKAQLKSEACFGTKTACLGFSAFW